MSRLTPAEPGGCPALSRRGAPGGLPGPRRGSRRRPRRCAAPSRMPGGSCTARCARAPPEPVRNEPYKTHLAYVKERRSDEDGAAILDEALAALRARRGG